MNLTYRTILHTADTKETIATYVTKSSVHTERDEFAQIHIAF
jgi:hypothetical protein